MIQAEFGESTMSNNGIDPWDPASGAAQQFCKIAHAALDMLFSTRDATTAAVATLSLAVVFREINSGIGNALYMDGSVNMTDVLNRAAERCNPDRIRADTAEHIAELNSFG